MQLTCPAPSRLTHTFARPIRAPRLTYRRCLLLLLVVGVAARLVRYLLCFPIWGDEAFICLNLHHPNWLDLAGPLRFDQVAPVLFLWIEWAAYHFLGASEIALRLPSLLAGVAALLLFVPLSRRVLPTKAALLAVGLLAVSYYPVRHAVEVKPYAFDLFVSTSLLSLAAAWLHDPGRRRPLLLLTGFVPVALAASYPAVFVAGAVSLTLLPVVRCRNDPMIRLLFGLYNVLLLSTFTTLFLLVGRQQHAAMIAFSSGYWDASFPPAAPLEWPVWLLSSHTGNLFAYPVGGKAGASALTFFCCLLGVRELWRGGKRDLLALLTAPFLLTLAAAVLRKYPYGGSARVAQHLAPSICLLAGFGLSTFLRRRAFPVAILLLVLLGMGGVVRDLLHPYKTPGDEQVRRLARQLSERTGPNDYLLVCEAPERLHPSIEWYLRLSPQVVWAGGPRELCTDLPPDLSRTERLWCLFFLTNECPETLDTEPPDGNEFRRVSRERFALQLGDEPNAIRWCEVWLLRRVGNRNPE